MVPNASESGDTVNTGCGAAIPVPVKETVKGSGSADSEMEIVPVMTPIGLGANLTTILQFLPARKVVPHVDVKV
jgi:hypothetical protein